MNYLKANPVKLLILCVCVCVCACVCLFPFTVKDFPD